MRSRTTVMLRRTDSVKRFFKVCNLCAGGHSCASSWARRDSSQAECTELAGMDSVDGDSHDSRLQALSHRRKRTIACPRTHPYTRTHCRYAWLRDNQRGLGDHRDLAELLAASAHNSTNCGRVRAWLPLLLLCADRVRVNGAAQLRHGYLRHVLHGEHWCVLDVSVCEYDEYVRAVWRGDTFLSKWIGRFERDPLTSSLVMIPAAATDKTSG